MEPRLAHLTRYPQEKHIHKAMMYYDVLFYSTEIIYIPRADHKPIGPFPPNWARARVIYARLFKSIQQHTVCFTENNWTPHLLRVGNVHPGFIIIIHNYSPLGWSG
jgi:hypothetical protein